jgi:hypothetical protein
MGEGVKKCLTSFIDDPFAKKKTEREQKQTCFDKLFPFLSIDYVLQKTKQNAHQSYFG